MPLPDSLTVEIEFTAGVWTDVSQYFDADSGGSTQFGRQSPFSQPAPGTLSLTLDNIDGRFTPGRQTLVDGTANPYYPNVVPRKRIRLSLVLSATTYRRYTGYIKGWPTLMVDGQNARVLINAVTIDERLARITMIRPIQQEIDYLARTNNAPFFHYWPLTDPAGTTKVSDAGSFPAGTPDNVGGPCKLRVYDSTGTVAPTFGADGPVSMNGTAVTFSPDSSSVGQYLRTPVVGRWQAGWTLMAWVFAGSTGAVQIAVSAEDEAGTINAELGLDATGKALYRDAAGSTAGGSNITGGWHLISANAGALLVDGVIVASIGSSIAGANPQVRYRVGSGVGGNNNFTGRIAHVLHHNPGSVPPTLTLTDHQRIAAAGIAGLGETVDARIARFLRYAGLSASDYNLDASTVVLSSYDQNGKDIVTAYQDAAMSEGGQAVVYVGTDGKVQFRNRNARKPGAPSLTVDNEADLDGSTYAPAFDDTQVVNQVQGTRATGTTTPSTQTVNDAASQAAYGLVAQSFTSYAQDDDDILANAQDQLAQQRNPGFRLGQVTVDLLTATTSGVYSAVAATDISDRIRVTNLPPRAAPATQIDAIAEGWSDQFSATEYKVTFDTSPADNPAKFVWDDTSYGRWGCDGNTLNADITSSATTLAIATAAGKAVFSSNSGSYPLVIKIGEEHIRLNGVPGGSTSPQTFTGCTRGVDGTAAAAQTAGAVVSLAPAPTWTL